MNTTHSSVAPEVPGYVELQRQIHRALLAQHPEWILPNGEAPTCASYDARFAEVLSQMRPGATGAVVQANIGSSQLQLRYA